MRIFGRKQVPNLFLVLLRSPRLLLPWTAFASRLMPYGRLDPKDRERMILRIAWNCRCRYEWLQHVEIGLSVGLVPDDVRDIPLGPGAQPDPRRRALISACDELHRDRRIGDETAATLRAALTDDQLLEAMLLVGHYEGLAGLLNSTAVELEQEVLARVASVSDPG
jgi:4-carboxymuconolactone decarboxylase